MPILFWMRRPMEDANMESYIRGLDYQSGLPIELVLKDGYIEKITELQDESMKDGLIIAPGLIDIQINGYKGFDFNKSPLSKEEWESVTNHLLRVGVTTF